MARKRKDGILTRRRLLESACEIFAEKGYRDAKIADICRRAEANIAAVNYHFGDKATLYARALEHAYERASSRYPIDGGLGLDSSPRARLRAYVDAHLRRTFSDDEASHFPRIIVKEMAEPTESLHGAVREVLRPHREHLRGVLTDLLGVEATDRDVRLCVMSIVSQCYFFGFNRAIRQRHFDSAAVTEECLEALIDHITDFCLSGVMSVRARRLQAQSSTSPAPGSSPCAGLSGSVDGAGTSRGLVSGA